jgi:hypothetical protein
VLCNSTEVEASPAVLSTEILTELDSSVVLILAFDFDFSIVTPLFSIIFDVDSPVAVLVTELSPEVRSVLTVPEAEASVVVADGVVLERP